MKLVLKGRNGNKDVVLENVKEYIESVRYKKIYVSYEDNRENEEFSMMRYMATQIE